MKYTTLWFCDWQILLLSDKLITPEIFFLNISDPSGSMPLVPVLLP